MEEIPFFSSRSDDAEQSQNFISGVRGTLKRTDFLKIGDTEDDEDELDEIIQSVLTDGQKATYKICKESMSKKGRISRGDVRGLFVPGATLFRKPGISNNSAENVCDLADVPPPDYDDQDDDVDGGADVKHEKNIIRHPNKVMSNRNSRRFQIGSPDLLNIFEALFDSCSMETACCKIHHIGRNDCKRMNVFAETEIRTIFRQNGDLKINKMQTKRKEKDLGVFGVSLEALLTRDCKKNPHLKVPLFLQTLVSKLENHLEEEGILRVPGSLARIKEVVQQLETSENYSIILQPLLPHDLVGLLKRFFRDLPTPILTLNWIDAFCKVAINIKDEKLKLHAFQTLMCVLPDVNRATLQVLFGLLVKIVKNPQNKMTEQTITTIITPSLFLVDSLPSAPTPTIGYDSLALFSPIVMYFLKHYNLIWDVPPLFLKQIREVNQKQKTKWMSGRRSVPAGSNKDIENSEELITVHSLHVDSQTITIISNSSISVAEVLQRFNKFKEPRFLESSCLFENGGNIEQRLLHPEEKIRDILQENKSARFSFARQSVESLITHWPPKLI